MKTLFVFFCCFTLSLGIFQSLAQITSVDPDTVVQGESIDIVITAENIDFTQGSNVVHFTQNGTSINPASATDSKNKLNLFNAFNSNSPAGYYNVSIWNTSSNKRFEKSNALFVLPDPTKAALVSITPNTAKQAELITLTIKGENTNFNTINNRSSVSLWSDSKRIYPTSIHPIDSFTLEVQFNPTYAHPAGKYTLMVQSSLDGTMSIVDGFELQAGLNPPRIISVTPDQITQGEVLEINVTAENIDFSQGSNIVELKQGSRSLRFDKLTLASNNQIAFIPKFNIDYPVGYYDFIVSNYSTGISVSKEKAIYLHPDKSVASIESLSPEFSRRGETVRIRIHGKNTNFHVSGATKRFYLFGLGKAIRAMSLHVIDSVTLEAEFEFTYSYPVGTYSLMYTNDLDGTLTFENAFELHEGANVPTILQVTPDTMILGETLDIEVTAKNVDFTQGSNIVSLKQATTTIRMNSSSASSRTTLSANITLNKDVPEGLYLLSIWNTSFDITLLANQTLIKQKAFYLKTASIPDGIEKTVTSEMLFYPNPASNLIYLNFTYDLIQIYDISGQLMSQSRFKNQLDVSKLKKGNYLVKFFKRNQIGVKKLIIE